MTDMKYIVAKNLGELIYIFDASINHSSMAMMLCLNSDEIVSAGSVRHNGVNVYCYGKSVTLGKESRKDVDTRLLHRKLGCEED